MDYRELNKATLKDYFPLPFIDQVLDALAGKIYFSFLDGFNGYNLLHHICSNKSYKFLAAHRMVSSKVALN